MKHFIKEWVLPVVAVFVLALLVQRFVFFHVLVPTGSMIPTINTGDRMLVVREYRPKSLKTGDIVVFKVRPEGVETLYVKRLIGTPGDTVEIVGGKVSVNGVQLVEAYVKRPDRYNGVFNVPANKYFFMGDNRIDSKDSRYPEVGFIDESDILAKAGLRFWPLDNLGFVR